MRFPRQHIFFFLLGIMAVSCHRSASERHGLSGLWQFRQIDSASWMPARVPGVVHMDLLRNNLIPDPFAGNNEAGLQWIGERTWEYRTSFPGDQFVEKEHVELVFEGIDTYAEVYLNDSLLFWADNMFRTWVSDVKGLLKSDTNELLLRFYAPENIELKKAAQLDYSLPDIRGFTRKAPYQYGWDWGPKFLTAGIWKPVYIRTWDDARLGDIHVSLKELNDSVAWMQALVEVYSRGGSSIELNVLHQGRIVATLEKGTQLKRGLNTLQMMIRISDPRVWWPSGLGEQPLYDFEFTMTTAGSSDSKSVRTGIRDVQLVMEPDSIGESFYFRVNGLPVFMKGANYIPQDNFLSRVGPDHYEKTLRHALDANMNMLRVWGGGIYEDDKFYDYCDEHGILVWQDFMFACNMYPGDSAFLENVREEAVQQVRRLRNHPSVVLWCGNNEADEGWHNWGWQRSLDYSPEDSAEVWNNYKKLFHELLPAAVAENSPTSPYVSSSPRIGWGHEEALYEGDMHYWGVWWGEEPFEIYEQKVGRFMSEFGFQGFPDLRTFDGILGKDDFSLDSDALKNHQKHPRGMEIIRTYMERDFPVPDNFEHYAYVSQLLQAHGLKIALEAHRRAKPRCMGTLYWQLNDCWPVISWSGIDYENRWKTLHYEVRRIYSDYLISFEQKEDDLAIFIISDRFENSNALLELELMDFDGHILWEDTMDVSVPANSSGIFLRKKFDGIQRNSTLLSVSLWKGQDKLAEAVRYFAPPRELRLPQTTIDLKVNANEEGSRIILVSPKLAKSVYIQSDGPGFFSGNYFDLLPNIPQEIFFRPGPGENPGDTKFRVMHLADITAP